MLVWVFVGCTCHFVGFDVLRLIFHLAALLHIIIEPWHDKTSKVWHDKTSKVTVHPAKTQISLASAQSDQSLHCALSGYLRTEGFFMRTVKTLIRLGGCPGWSESSLATQLLCWFCHVTAYMAKQLKQKLKTTRNNPSLSRSMHYLGFKKKKKETKWRNKTSKGFENITVALSCSSRHQVSFVFLNEPRHDKTNKMSVRPAKTQISLGIRPAWSVSSLSAWRNLGSLATHWAHIEDWSDLADAQADLSLRWAHTHFIGFVMLWLKWLFLW